MSTDSQFTTQYPTTTQQNADSIFVPVDYQSVTPSDTVDLTGGMCRGLWIGGAGNVVVITAKGTTVTISGALAGSIIPGYFTRVKSTSTTATLILAIY